MGSMRREIYFLFIGLVMTLVHWKDVKGAPFDAMDLNSVDNYGLKAKRPFCNAFTGCGRKRSDPDIDLASDLDQEAEQLGEHMITGLSPLELMESRKFGLSRLRPESGQLGFFPGYLKRK